MFGAELTGVTATVGMFISWGEDGRVDEAAPGAGDRVVPDGRGWIGWDRCPITWGAVGRGGTWRYVVFWDRGLESVNSVSLLLFTILWIKELILNQKSFQDIAYFGRIGWKVWTIGEARSLSPPPMASLSPSFLVTQSWRIKVRVLFCLDKGRPQDAPFSIIEVAVSREPVELIGWSEPINEPRQYLKLPQIMQLTGLGSLSLGKYSVSTLDSTELCPARLLCDLITELLSRLLEDLPFKKWSQE